MNEILSLQRWRVLPHSRVQEHHLHRTRFGGSFGRHAGSGPAMAAIGQVRTSDRRATRAWPPGPRSSRLSGGQITTFYGGA